MSRIGNLPITIPGGVTVNVEGLKVRAEGPKGKLETIVSDEVIINIENGVLKVTLKKTSKQSKALHGLTRALINNMIIGVTEGWTKDLEMVGVGYRAQGGEDNITLSVGFSHPVIVKAPEGVTFKVIENNKISVMGIDKAKVGQIAANLRSVKPPEVYKGKGIRYVGEFVRKKPGKAGKAIVGGAK